MALGGMFVLQSTSANLYALRAPIARGIASAEPALFSVFIGAAPAASGLAPYLSAAAAMQSRAFPAFSYDAAADSNWVTRFSPLPYVLAVDGDAALQRVIVDARLMLATRRCLWLWRRLQEHGGVHDAQAQAPPRA